MTTVEKLFVQIFDTKSRIIQQINQQTELYHRHLASKALSHAVTPPSSLWNPNNSTSQPLSKEDLISELLPPLPPPSRPPVRNSIAGTSRFTNNFIKVVPEVDDGFGTKAHGSYTDGNDVGEGPSTIVEGNGCIGENTLNCIPELDVSSPVDVVDSRISNIYSAPDQSLARIQRSKSRQKAIEQRNSATSQAKSNSRNECSTRGTSSRHRLFVLDDEQTGHIDNSDILSEPCAIRGSKQSTCDLINENNSGACLNEIKLTTLDPEQVHSVNERPRSPESFSFNVECCGTEGKSETENENLGEGFDDHDGPVAMSKSSGKRCSPEKPTPRNSEGEDKEFSIFSKVSTPSRDAVEMYGDVGSGKGDAQSEEKGVMAHSESSTRSKSAEKSSEGTESKKEESGIEEKGSAAYVKNSSTSKRPAQQENHLSDCMEENYFSEFIPEIDFDNITSGNVELYGTKGKSETENEKSGEGFDDRAGQVAMSKRSGRRCSLEKPTLRNSEAEDKDFSIFNKVSTTSRDAVEIDGDIGSGKGDAQSEEKDVMVHAESSTRSRRAGKSSEDTASKKEESGTEEKGSAAYVKNSSTSKRPAQQENHLSDCMEENYFSEFEPEKDFDNITSGDPESNNNQICSFDGLLEKQCLENGSGKWIISPNAGQEVSNVRESYLEDDQPQNDPNCLKLASVKKASLPYENSYPQMMDAGTNVRLHCDSTQQLDGNEFSVAVRELDRSVHKISEDSPLNSQSLKAASNFSSDGRSFAQFKGFDAEKSIFEDSQFQRASGDHVMLLCSDMCGKAEPLESVNKIEAIKPGTVKLAETLYVSREDDCRENSLGNSCSPFSEAAAGLPRDSFTSSKAGDSGINMTKSEPRRSWHYEELEAHHNNGQHLPSNDDASTRSSLSNTINDVKYSSEQGCESLLELPVEEEECYSTKNYENIGNHPQEKSETSSRSRWTEEVAESTLEGSFVANNLSYPSSVYYAISHQDEQMSDIKSDDHPLDIEKLSCSGRSSSEGRVSLQVDGHQPQHSDQSPRHKDLELMINEWGKNLPESFKEEGHLKKKSLVGEDGTLPNSGKFPHIEELYAKDADQSLPELELFLIDSPSEDDTLGFPGDMITFDNFELPRSTIARVSMLERLCKSASACSPLSHLSSAFKMEKGPDLFHSVPNGLLEHTDLVVHFQNDVSEFQVSLSTSNEAKGGLQGVSRTPIGFSVNGLSSPEGRFWEGYSSRSYSSGKRLSSNPEFECFTIEEDPCISVGKESADEDNDKVSKDVDSLTVNSPCISEGIGSAGEDNDKLPKDVDSLTANWHAFDSDKFLEDTDSLTAHCAARQPSTGTHNKFKSFLRSSHTKNGTGKDTQTPLVVASGKRMAKESLNNRYKKLKTSGKSSLKNERLNGTRETYCSNIVSNLTSFIPLVQQKQAAAKACLGRREIKVKALEAAEATKRLEEKRENERKLKKEELKKDRARAMEQEKAKQIELLKKKKEDEQRRKDADMALRKRLREEEERKEERKRIRTEETRRKQRDQEIKLHSKKAGTMDSKKKSIHELKPSQMKKSNEEHVRLDNESRPAAISSSDVQQPSTCSNDYNSADLCDNNQANCTPDKAKTSYFVREKSYEISPYQSDDEDDEDDELRAKKFIPSWASKNLVAESLSLMLEVHPSVIFPPESRCSMDEVLLPRKLQKVQPML